MPWWLVWVLLVVAAIALLVWVGLRLWRIFRGLLHELEEAQVVLDRLTERLEELEEAAAQAQAIAPEIVITPERREELQAVRAEVRATRRARKQARYDRMSARWDHITGGDGSTGGDEQ